jgi:hypothetical protein
MLRHEAVKRERTGGGKRANEESIEYRVWSIGDGCRFGWRGALNSKGNRRPGRMWALFDNFR